jgi:uncharacterized protein
MEKDNIVNWFDIPVADLDRAIGFYETVMAKPLKRYQTPEIEGALLPANGVSGTLIKGKGFTPSTQGAVIYLNGGEDLSGLLSRAERAGGKVLLPKTEIGGDMGYYAYFQDSEGNRIGIHSSG